MMQLSYCCLVSLLLVVGVLADHPKPCKVKCHRVEKHVQFGFDAAARELTVDVGECRRIEQNSSEGCSNHTVQHPCEEKQCTVRANELWTYTNRDGIFSVPVVKSCYPTWHHCLADCVRKPNILYMFPQSKYQTRVDLGKCTGNCTGGKQCSAVSTRNISVEGPNGAVAIETIERCGCVNPSCYRVDYYESYWDYVSYNNHTLRRENKVINVGKCVGLCEGVISEERCFPSKHFCQLRIPGRPTKCVPSAHHTDSYIDSKGRTHEVVSIDECGCGLG